MDRRTLRIALLAALALGACDHQPTTADTVAGLYTLVSADGGALPATLSESESGSVRVTGGSLNLTSDVDCVLQRDFRNTSGNSVNVTHDVAFCSWTRTGSAISLRLEGAAAVAGTVEDAGATLTFTLDGHALRFER